MKVARYLFIPEETHFLGILLCVESSSFKFKKKRNFSELLHYLLEKKEKQKKTRCFDDFLEEACYKLLIIVSFSSHPSASISCFVLRCSFKMKPEIYSLSQSSTSCATLVHQKDTKKFLSHKLLISALPFS